MALRYLRTPPGLPSRCDGCGESFTLQHGLDCPKGAYVARLGTVWVIWLLWFGPRSVREGDPASDDPGLCLNLGVRGVWQPQVEVLFDIRVIDTDAPSCNKLF